MKRRLELLAPARDLACGKAAIDHGADAVYIGAQRFGARAAAGNSVADIAELCRYAHQFKAKVYVTVNTIIYDEELDDAHRLLSELEQAGADAVLVQDMALVYHCHKSQTSNLKSQIPLHASTQTDNRTAEKVAWLRDLGFKRVVLARELSIDEIRAIHEAVPDVELEVFVHGALCVSYSGLCYASQYCFHRSANRGECAQFCRMPFDLIDADGNVIEKNRHLLSLKDLCQYDNLEALAEAGAMSFKIEGRLKDVSYVKNVTAAYSERLNEIIRRHPDKYCRASLGHCRYTFTPNLHKTFNRGYTEYFAHGRRPDIASFDTPKAMGEYVGTVKELRRDSLTVAGIARFANGDGLCFLSPLSPQHSAFSHQSSPLNTQHSAFSHQPSALTGFRVNRVEGNRLFPQKMPEGLRPGMRLYRNNDQEMEHLLACNSAERKIPITMTLCATADGFQLSAEIVADHAERSAAIGNQQTAIAAANQQTDIATVGMVAEHQTAEKPQRDNIVRQLTKLGNTPYECSTVNLSDDFNYFIPSSLLAEMRRKVCEELCNSLECRVESKSSLECRVESKEFTNAIPTLPTLHSQPNEANIANREASAFYGVDAPTAYELKPTADARLMQCRHCLRYSLGLCTKHPSPANSKLSTLNSKLKTPLFLRLGDGRRFRLEFDCKNCQMNVFAALQGTRRLLRKLISLSFIIYHLSFSVACYNRGQLSPDAWDLTEQQLDSISFYTTHHYTQGYNFIVRADSLPVIQQLPAEVLSDMPVDTMMLFRNEHIVVADITTIPADSIDSVWVKVARDQFTFGWLHEHDMLQAVSPDDPISEFIDTFSDVHRLLFFALVVVVAATYVIIRLSQRHAKMVHFNDIASFYPTLLCLLVAASATFYSSIQLFGPEKWRHFYYHPTLNPFAVPLSLQLFLCSVWAIIIVAVAVVDDVRRQLPVGQAVLYLLGLGATCAVAYVVFSVSTLYYIGYPLLVAYFIFAMRRYAQQPYARYYCGHCNAPLQKKGICPHCGAINE